MDIAQANQIKTEILNRKDQQKQKKYITSICNYAKFIKNAENPRCVEYLFNILREVGYLAMMGSDWNQNDLSVIIPEVFSLEMKDNGNHMPTSVLFEDLLYETDKYISMCNELNKKMPTPPRADELEKKEIWDNMWWEMEDCGVQLILRGFDIIAVKYGYQLIVENNKIRGWQTSWNNFKENSNIYLQKLYNIKECFYSFSNVIFKIFIKFPGIPNEKFRNFIIDITHQSYALKNHYRQIISPEEAEETYFHTKLRFQNYPSAAWIHFYKTALGEQTLKKFIVSVCCAKAGDLNISDKWEITTASEQDYDYSLPIIRAGKTDYSVHMLNNIRVGGWGIRKDLVMKHFSDDEFQGALFCSMKEYPSGNILVRFENYIEKKGLKELVAQKTEDFKNYIRLSFDDVYKVDLRDAFLNTAAESAIGISEVVESEPAATPIPDLIPSDVVPVFEELLATAAFVKQKANDLVSMVSQSFFNKYEYAQGMGGAEEEPPEEPVIFVPMIFPDKEQDIPFFQSDGQNKIEPLKRYVSAQGNWRFIAFYAADNKPIIQHDQTPQDFCNNENVELQVETNTQAVMIAFGPEDEIEELQNAFSKTETPREEEHRIYWVFYGPSE